MTRFDSSFRQPLKSIQLPKREQKHPTKTILLERTPFETQVIVNSNFERLMGSVGIKVPHEQSEEKHWLSGSGGYFRPLIISPRDPGESLRSTGFLMLSFNRILVAAVDREGNLKEKMYIPDPRSREDIVRDPEGKEKVDILRLNISINLPDDPEIEELRFFEVRMRNAELKLVPVGRLIVKQAAEGENVET
jgi:hypothetical protein